VLAVPDLELTFVSQGRRDSLTLRELGRRSAARAAGMQRRGLRPQDRVVVQLPSSVELFVTMVAALRAGLVIVPLPTSAGSQHLTAAVTDSGAKLLVVADERRGTGYPARLAAVSDVATLAAVHVAGPGAPADLALERLDGGDFDPVAVSPDSACALIYTSGSSATPKGVLHSHNSLLAEVQTGWASQSGEADRRSFVPLPPGHIGGLISALVPLVTRRPAAFLEPWGRSSAVELIRSTGATFMGAVPFFLIELLDAAAGDPAALAPLRFASIGGAGVPPVLVERADALGIRAARSYGLTEHPTISGGTATDSLALRAGTDGRLSRGSRVRIVDPAGDDVPPGEVGEIVSIGPEMMLGYTDPELDVANHVPGGWFRTGDLGRLDGDTLTVTGRLKEIIIRGGENIAASDVENVLMRHPAVLDAAVVGVPDDRYGERVLAVVVPRAGMTLDLAGVHEHFAAAGSSRRHVPELLDVVDALPRGATGKVQRGQLREQWSPPPSDRPTAS